jgi:hypothetical protein
LQDGRCPEKKTKEYGGEISILGKTLSFEAPRQKTRNDVKG